MKTLLKFALAALLVSFGSTGWGQNVYNKFSPSTGVLKGSSTSYFTQAAVSADIRGLWSGTCDSTTFLRGDGSCVAPAGTGITFSMPSGFTVTGSPGTSISVTTALSGVLKGTGSAFTTAAAADIYGLWSGTCNSTTFLRGDGSCQTPAGGSGTPSSPTNSVQYNNAGAFGGSTDFIWTPGTDTLNVGGSSAGNITPVATASTGATLNVKGGTGGATNAGGPAQVAGGAGGGTSGNGGAASVTGGSSTSGAGGLATLSGGTSASGNGGNAQVIGGNAGFSSGNAGSVTISGGTAGASSGGNVTITATPNGGAGTNGTITLNGGGVLLGSPTGGDPGAGALNTAGDIKVNNVSVCRSDGTNCGTTNGSFTATIVGCTSSPTLTVTYSVFGKIVTLRFPSSATCTSNSTGFSMSGATAAVRPSSGNVDGSLFPDLEDNGNTTLMGAFNIDSSGTMTFSKFNTTTGAFSSVGFTAANTKGLCCSQATITYQVP